MIVLNEIYFVKLKKMEHWLRREIEETDFMVENGACLDWIKIPVYFVCIQSLELSPAPACVVVRMASGDQSDHTGLLASI